MKENFVALLIIGAVASLPIIFVVGIYAKVSTCGWKGLFVECRIMDCPK